MTLSYFVYYRVAQGHAAGIAAQVRGMQAELAAATGVSGRLLQKDDASGTWMEVYEGVPDGAAFEAGLQQAVLRAGLQGLPAVDGARHVERFVAAD
jgi:multidrug resistance efflux pump